MLKKVVTSLTRFLPILSARVSSPTWRHPICALIAFLALSAPALAQTTVTLQHGVNGYSGTTDAWLWSGAPDTNESTQQTINLRAATTVGVMKFAIFAAEGGPVPDGATITSATLSLYKYGTNDGVFNALRLLRPWNVSQVTWNSAASGTAWQTAGATGANDVTSSGEAQFTLGSVEGWGDFNVTTQVQAMANGNNHGWRLQAIGGSSLPHNFSAADDNDATKHPKLTITYTTAPADNTATLQQGLNSYTGTSDAWLWSGDPDTNVGADVTWNIRGSTTAAVLKFAIFAAEGGPVPDNATISSATLSIYKFGTNDGVFNAKRLLRAWNESQVTWNNAATGSAWQAGGAAGATDVTAAGEAQMTLGGVEGWGDFDVTAAVQAMAGGNNHGWRLQAIGGSNLPHNFGAKENSSQMLRPKLTITYNGPGTPNAQLSATPQSGAAPLQVVFNASASSDGGSPITELKLQFGDGAEVSWTDKTVTQSHTYAAVGNYTATLVVSNMTGDSAPATRPIVVTTTGGGGGSPIAETDILARPRADVLFSGQAGGLQALGDDTPLSQVPEQGIHDFDAGAGYGTLRFGKQPNPEPDAVSSSPQVLAFMVAPHDPLTKGEAARRSELAFGEDIQFGKVYWAALKVYVVDWNNPADTDDSLFGTQVHAGVNASGGQGPSFGIFEYGTRGFRIRARSGTCTENAAHTQDVCESPNKFWLPAESQAAPSIPFGRWSEFIFKFRHGAGANGLLQVWQDGTQIVDYHGSLGWTNRQHGNEYIKFGYYNWGGTAFENSGQPRKVLLDSPVLIKGFDASSSDKYTVEQIHAFMNPQP